jgi:uncharacterized protein
VKISLEQARRLAVTRQSLAGCPPPASPRGIVNVVRNLRCVQLDPTNVVARTQHLVLLARLGFTYQASDLDDVAWARKELFSYWAHAASFVLTEDFPIHAQRMRRWPEGNSTYAILVRRWMRDNAAMRRHILRRIRQEGPLRSRDITVTGAVPWRSAGWNSGQDVTRMLEFLWIKGKVMVAGRRGADRFWDLAERWFPDWTPRDLLSQRQAVERAVFHSLGALGVATAEHISRYFIRDGYTGLEAALLRLQRRKDIVPVVVGAHPDRWFVRADVAETIAPEGDPWEPRTTLLSPFDNLIADRVRSRELFDFDYAVEIYVPKAKRRFGYYVLPILHGDKLIGRIDSRMDREANVYTVNHVFVEEDAPRDRSTAAAVKEGIEGLAAWLGATSVRFGTVDAWKTALR